MPRAMALAARVREGSSCTHRDRCINTLHVGLLHQNFARFGAERLDLSLLDVLASPAKSRKRAEGEPSILWGLPRGLQGCSASLRFAPAPATAYLSCSIWRSRSLVPAMMPLCTQAGGRRAIRQAPLLESLGGWHGEEGTAWRKIDRRKSNCRTFPNTSTSPRKLSLSNATDVGRRCRTPVRPPFRVAPARGPAAVGVVERSPGRGARMCRPCLALRL